MSKQEIKSIILEVLAETHGSTNPTKLVDDVYLAEMTGITKRTFQNWRVDGTGPKFIKLGSCIRYRLADVLAWLEENERESTAAQAH